MYKPHGRLSCDLINVSRPSYFSYCWTFFLLSSYFWAFLPAFPTLSMLFSYFLIVSYFFLLLDNFLYFSYFYIFIQNHNFNIGSNPFMQMHFILLYIIELHILYNCVYDYMSEKYNFGYK